VKPIKTREDVTTFYDSKPRLDNAERNRYSYNNNHVPEISGGIMFLFHENIHDCALSIVVVVAANETGNGDLHMNITGDFSNGASGATVQGDPNDSFVFSNGFTFFQWAPVGAQLRKDGFAKTYGDSPLEALPAIITVDITRSTNIDIMKVVTNGQLPLNPDTSPEYIDLDINDFSSPMTIEKISCPSGSYMRSEEKKSR
jgi:hypothetical protein